MDRKTQAYIPGHLNSPICSDEINFLLDHDNFFCYRHNKIKEILNTLDINQHIYDSSCHPYDCLLNYFETYKNVENCEFKFKENFNIALIAYMTHLIDYTKKPSNDESILQHIEDIKINCLIKNKDFLVKYYRMKLISESIKDKICFIPIEMGTLIKLDNNISVEQDISIFKCPKHQNTVILPTTLLLCVLDLMQTKFPLFLYWSISDGIKKYNLKIFDIGKRMFGIFETLRTKYREKVYKVLSNWDPLILGYSIKYDPHDTGFPHLYDTTRESLLEIINENEFQSLLPNLNNEEEVIIYLELLGITKSFGHPCLAVLPGFQSVQEHVCESVNISHYDVEPVLWTFRKDFCNNYYTKHRRWPKMRVDNLSEPLKGYISKNVRPPKMKYLPLSAWSDVFFEQNFDYDYTPDTTELIKDSAIATPLSCWSQNYDHCAFKHLYNKPKPYTETPAIRRVISRYLVGTEYEVRMIIAELDTGYFYIENLIAILCQKERELNEKGRYFVKQTYIQRLAQTSSELNISKTIFRYISSQTMTDGELQLLNKECSTIRSMNGDTEIIVMDFEKWNLRFRHQTVEPFGKDLDRLFGLNCFYTKSHLWYPSLCVFVNSRLCPPDYDLNGNPIPGDYMYNDHMGGMQGMHQKKWTFITESLIKYIADSFNLKVTILCQGDNQVVVLRYTKDQLELKEEVREKFLSALMKHAARLNLRLKSKETWVSNSLFEYGKVRYFRGKAIPPSTKKAARLIPDINDGLSSMSSSLSTINTVTEAIAKGDITSGPAFILNQFEILNYFERKLLFAGKTKTDRVIQKECLLFFPAIFGGINLSHYFSHCARGHDDQLTMWLNTLRTFCFFREDLKIHIFKLIRLNPIKGIPQEKLINDIFSLRIRSLPTIENDFKERALNYLMSDEVTNPEIRKLFEGDTALSKETIYSNLLKMKPFYPSLCHELARLSNYGLLLQHRSKFVNVQTINKSIQRDEELDYLTEMDLANKETIHYIQKQYNLNSCNYSKILIEKMVCPTKLAIQLRKDHWELDLVGETKPYPIHQYTLIDKDLSTSTMRNESIHITLSEELIQLGASHIKSGGPFHPYLGSITRQKTKKPKIDVFEESSLLKSIRQLITLRSWFKRSNSEGIIQFIDLLLKEKLFENKIELETDDVFDWNARVYGGHPLHRLHSMVERNAGVINNLPISISHISFSTDKMTSIMKGGRDYTIFFQLIFVTLQSQILHFKFLNDRMSPQYLAHFNCGDCTKEISDVQLDMPKQDNSLYNLIPATSYLKQIYTLDDQEIQFKEPNYSPIYLQKLISLYIGTSLGLDQDISSYSFYNANTSPFEENPHSSTINIGITEFRLCDLYYVVIGVLNTSKALRNLIIDKKSQLFIQDSSLSCFAKYLLHTDRVSEFLHITQVVAYEHSQLISAKSLSTLVCQGIVNLFNQDSEKIVKDLVRYNFPENTLLQLVSKTKWLIKFHLQPTKLSKRYQRLILKRDFSKKQIFNFIKQAFNILHHNLEIPITQDETLILFRQCIRSNTITNGTFSWKNSFKPTITSVHLVLDRDIYSLSNCYNILQAQLNPIVEEHSCNLKYIHHLTRPLGNISSSCNKVYEILSLIGLNRAKINTTFCLAEGSGSIALLFAKLYNSNIIFNTWMSPEIDSRQSGGNDPTSFLNSSKNIQDKLKYKSLMLEGETNILSKKFIDKFEIVLKSEQYKIDCFTMDAESKFDSNNLIFLTTYLPYIEKCSTTFNIFKLFYNKNLLTLLSDIFGKRFIWTIIKPLSSHPNNKECYLLFVPNSSLYSIIISSFKEIHEQIHINILESDIPILRNLETNTFYITQALESGKYLYNKSLIDKLNFNYSDKWNFAINNDLICSRNCLKILTYLYSILNIKNEDQSQEQLNWIFTGLRHTGLKNMKRDYHILLNILLYINLSKDNLTMKLCHLYYEDRIMTLEGVFELNESILNAYEGTKSWIKSCYKICKCDVIICDPEYLELIQETCKLHRVRINYQKIIDKTIKEKKVREPNVDLNQKLYIPNNILE